MSDHTPGPWVIPAGVGNEHVVCQGGDRQRPGEILFVVHPPIGRSRVRTDGDIEANAEHIVRCVNAYDGLVMACQLQEAADLAHVSCDECDPEDAPETCAKCFPLYDVARIARRMALSAVEVCRRTVEGGPQS